MSTQTRPLPATNKQPPNNPPKGWAKAGVNGPNNANGANPTISRALPKQPNQSQRTSSPTAAPPKGLAKSTAVPIPKRPRNIQSSVQLPNSLPNASELRNGMNRTVPSPPPRKGGLSNSSGSIPISVSSPKINSPLSNSPMNSPTTTSPLNQVGSPSLAKRSITSPGISKQSLGSRPTSPTPKVTIRSAPNSNPNSSNNSPAVSPRRNNDSDDAWRESRGKVIRELVETEQIFHSFTQILINRFLIPLRNSDKIVGSGETLKLFGNIEMVAAVSIDMYNELQKRIADPIEMSKVGEVFSLKAKEISSIYKAYCVGHKEAVELFQKLKKNKAFSAFLEEAFEDPSCKRLLLTDYLIMPVQRVCKYPLLLDKIIENTPKSHSDYAALQQGFEAINSLLQVVNASAKEAEVLTEILRVESKISDIPENLKLAVPGRTLVREAKWTKISKSNVQERQFFMFSDMLVYAKFSLLKKESYEYKGVCPFYTCEFVDHADSGDIKNAIAIIRKDSSQKKYIIYTKDAQQKKEWLALLQEAVKDLNGNKNTNGSHVKSNNSDSPLLKRTMSNLTDHKDRITMVQIEDRISGWKNDNAMRTYIDEGPVGVMKDGSSSVDQRYLFLFNDIVLLVKQVRKLSTKNPFQFVKAYEVKSNLIIQDIADTEDLESAFGAASMKDKEKFVFVFKTYEEKVKWYKYLAGEGAPPLMPRPLVTRGPMKLQIEQQLMRKESTNLPKISPRDDKSKEKDKKTIVVSPRDKITRKESKKIEVDDDDGDARIVVEGFEAAPWDPDSMHNECHDCKKQFTTTNRRHHCRNCGKVFCNTCTVKRTYLPKFGFTKKKVRVCEKCFLVH
jgi:hypothetical protein